MIITIQSDCLNIEIQKLQEFKNYNIKSRIKEFIYIVYKQIMFKKRINKQQTILNLNEENNSNNKYQKQQQKIQRQEPQKKIKIQQPKNIMSSSTTQNKQQKQAELHQQFKSLNYSSINNNQTPKQQGQNNSIEQLLLQEELAKKKYMQNVNATKDVKQGKVDTKVYRGINNYANYALTEDDILNAQQKFRKIQGPSRVNSTIRNTCRFDYNFGLCKDWHDSGYCPFGDSCIYLHDRSNYKTGWQQQKDFERAEKQRWRRISNPQLANKEQIQQKLKTIEKYKVQQTCQKCNKEFKGPVQVQCGHIFCTGCAVVMAKCVICKKTLGGIMNNAEKKMQKMKQTYQQLKQKILKQHEQNKVKRKKYDKIQSQDVFAE